MFEKIFEDYRKALESSFRMQQQMYRQWMNGWPVRAPGGAGGIPCGSAEDRIRDYQTRWSATLAEILETHRKALNEQYQSGIEAIESAFRTTEARTSEEYWRLTQEFWRKSIDSYKTAFEAQSLYVQGLTKMWTDMITQGRV
jgi:hypothetical protein